MFFAVGTHAWRTTLQMAVWYFGLNQFCLWPWVFQAEIFTCMRPCEFSTTLVMQKLVLREHFVNAYGLVTKFSQTPRFSTAQVWSAWKIMKNGWGLLVLKSRPSHHCWVRRNSRQGGCFTLDPVEGGFPGQRMTTNALSLHINCNMFRPQRHKVRLQALQAFLPNFSTKLRRLLKDFDEWPLVGKFEISATRGRQFCSHIVKEMNDRAVFKKGIHTFGSVFPKPYMQQPDQIVRVRHQGEKCCVCTEKFLSLIKKEWKLTLQLTYICSFLGYIHGADHVRPDMVSEKLLDFLSHFERLAYIEISDLDDFLCSKK